MSERVPKTLFPECLQLVDSSCRVKPSFAVPQTLVFETREVST